MADKILRVLHTSDWHIGQKLYNNPRHEEFEEFFNWLAGTIHELSVDALLVAGDVFDVKSPGNRAQEIYYRFLWQVSKTCCRHVVVIAGNHDSPDFLDAPASILKNFNVHVIGAPLDNPADEVLVLRDRAGAPELIVCAVPYLRERDVRKVEAGESVDEKNARLHAAIADHYRAVARAAADVCGASGLNVPVIGMGHLWTAGARAGEGEKATDLYYVGSLGQVSASVFPAIFDYVALGHLHGPQKVDNKDHIRYSGSPLPMSFDEATLKKRIYLLEFAGRSPKISEIEVPVFKQLISVKGDWPQISAKLADLAAQYADAESGPWVEVGYEGEEVVPGLSAQVDALVAGSGVMVLRKRFDRRVREIVDRMAQTKRLEEMTPRQVFIECMEKEIAESDWREYLETFDMVLRRMEEDEGREG